MELEKIRDKIPEKFYKELEKRIKVLTPPQEKAINAGLLDRKNIMVCAPTASGKTLIAELAMVKGILDNGVKAIYTVPLKALATEKFNEFKDKYESIGIRVALSIGDMDNADNYLGNYDIIICSNEKLDSLIRHYADWLKDVGVIIIDEVHLLNDPGRGPTLEVLITMLEELIDAQLVALSATVGNPEELAEWLKANLVKDTWRPIKLYEGISLHHNIDFFGEKKGFSAAKLSKDPVVDLAIDTINQKKQALVFVNTKRSAESVAEKLALALEKNALHSNFEENANKAIKAMTVPTKQCEKLAMCVKRGVAFHHSGLAPAQRKLIEDSFRNKEVKVICCTPTLALGLDLPTDRAIVRDLKRFTGYGTQWIPVLEMKQYIGRAGRPAYSTEGEAICIAKTQNEKDEIHKKYILGKPEEVLSKLAIEPILRKYILSLIAISFTNSREKLREFFEKTLWAHQYGDIDKIEMKVDKILRTLYKYGFIKIDENSLQATNLGIRVSQLYIDPLTAFHLINCIESAANEKDVGRDLSDIGMMQTVTETQEMKPFLKVRKAEYEDIQEELMKYEDHFYKQPDFIDEYFMDSFKTALMLKDWLNEKGEEFLFEKYKVTPGELIVKKNNADWLLYSFEQLAILRNRKQVISDVAKLRVRLLYGIKQELLPLVRFKQIGRVRARILFNAGVKDRGDIRKAGIEKLTLILKSREIAKKLLDQIEVRTRD